MQNTHTVESGVTAHPSDTFTDFLFNKLLPGRAKWGIKNFFGFPTLLSFTFLIQIRHYLAWIRIGALNRAKAFVTALY